MKNAYSVLVNTCDKFDDCWHPFFKLFSIYWPECKGKIYLNTEYKDYNYEGLDITATKVCEHNQDAHQITWSECLIRALNSIDNEVVLYLQEDYFFKASVKDDVVEKYVELMNEDKSIDCIYLTDQGSTGETIESKYRGLFPSDLNHRDFISCQAALWRKDTLISYLRSYETAWQFEEFGSKRGVILNNNFYVVDNNKIKLDESEIIPYIFTGVIQGRWYEKVIPLFSEHQINIDYTIRGFVKDAPKITLFSRLKRKFHRLPNLFRNNIEISIKQFQNYLAATPLKALILFKNRLKKLTLYKIKSRIMKLRVVWFYGNRFYNLLYISGWHGILFKPEKINPNNYFTAIPNKGAGIGHQMSNWISGYWFAKKFKLQFAHTPFSTTSWDEFLGFGDNEKLVSDLHKISGYKKVRLPKFEENDDKECDEIDKIINSYSNKKVIFVAEQDQSYADQFGVIDDIQSKYHNATARNKDEIIFTKDTFNIAIHVRRGDIVVGQKNGNENLAMRWLNNDYFVNVLSNVIDAVKTTKPVVIYLFSQGEEKDFPEFSKFNNLIYCLTMGAQQSFSHMVEADLLITSKSSFSYKPALLSKGIKVCPKNFWHGYPVTKDWILVENNGTFDGKQLRVNL